MQGVDGLHSGSLIGRIQSEDQADYKAENYRYQHHRQVQAESHIQAGHHCVHYLQYGPAEENARCSCHHSNYCIARMYSLDMACHQRLKEELPPCLKKEIERIESKG